MKRKARAEIVVETRGGTVVAMYCADPLARVMLVHWDEFEDCERPAVFFPIDAMSQMPSDTERLVKLGLAHRRRRVAQ
jgi:hypothetical protein